MNKDILINNFNILLEKRVKDKENNFSILNYRKFINSLKSLSKDTISYDELIKEIKIGKKIQDKVKELYDTGSIQEIEEIKKSENFNDKRQSIIDDFTRIWDVGLVKAQQLYDIHNIKSLKELKELSIEKKEEILTKNQLIGLKYLEDFEKRIPRKEMDKHNELLRKIFKKVSKDIVYEIVGSYRRNVETSGDIDVILTVTENSKENINDIIKKIVDLLKEKQYIIDDLVQGTHKYMGVCKLTKTATPRRLDIIVSAFNEYPFQILYFTGSPHINIQMRNVAIKYGLTLSQYGLKNKDTGLYIDLSQFKNEKDIFDFLKIKYLEPHERTKEALIEEL